MIFIRNLIVLTPESVQCKLGTGVEQREGFFT